MGSIRAWLSGNSQLAMLVIAAALCIKALIPAGYMVASGAQTLTVAICAPVSGDHSVRHIAIPMRDGSGGEEKGSSKDSPSDHCAFGASAKLGATGADPIVLAIALAFILVLGRAPVRRLPGANIPYLLPPLRGPPATR